MTTKSSPRRPIDPGKTPKRLGQVLPKQADKSRTEPFPSKPFVRKRTGNPFNSHPDNPSPFAVEPDRAEDTFLLHAGEHKKPRGTDPAKRPLSR